MLGYWHHTKLIPKLGWFEIIFNSPSHHRVHHGTNKQYLDRNYAEVLILWDKLFGSFEPENEEVRYGILRSPDTFSTLGINFHFWSLLWQDCLGTKSWWNKIRLWFMPLGWRPEDVRFRERVAPISLGTPKLLEVETHSNIKLYLFIQLITAFFFMFLTITPSFGMSTVFKFIAGFILLYNIESWKYLLDSRKQGLIHCIISTLMISASLQYLSVEISQIPQSVFTLFNITILLNLLRLILKRKSNFQDLKNLHTNQ